MLNRALKRFEKYGDRYFGFDLRAHRGEIRGWLDRVRTGSVGTAVLADLPKWWFAT